MCLARFDVFVVRKRDAFREEVDEVVCVITPEPFQAVGLWYGDFSETSAEEVRDLLERSMRSALRWP